MLAETRQIDLITTVGRTNTYRLLIVVETGEWQRKGARWLLWEKIGTYAGYAMGGAMQREDPASMGAPVRLVILSDDPLPSEIRQLVERLSVLLAAEGLPLFCQSPEDGGIDGPIEDDRVPPGPPPDGTNPGIRPRPEFPSSEGFVPALRYHRWRSTPSRKVQKLVLHVSHGQEDYRQTVRYFQNPLRAGESVAQSVHYVIGRGGEVVQMVRHDDIAWHTMGENAQSIGVAVVSSQMHAVTPEQYRATAQLVRFLSGLYQIPLGRERILLPELRPEVREPVLDWGRLMALVRLPTPAK